MAKGRLSKEKEQAMLALFCRKANAAFLQAGCDVQRLLYVIAALFVLLFDLSRIERRRALGMLRALLVQLLRLLHLVFLCHDLSPRY